MHDMEVGNSLVDATLFDCGMHVLLLVALAAFSLVVVLFELVVLVSLHVLLSMQGVFQEALVLALLSFAPSTAHEAGCAPV